MAAPRVFLEVGDTVSKDSQILGPHSFGDYHVWCSIYTSHPVKIEAREKDGDWHTVRIGGSELTITSVGDLMGLPVAKDLEYRCVTDTAGARVVLSKANPYDP